MGLIITSIILSLITMIGILVFRGWIEADFSKKWSLLGLAWLIIIIFGFFTSIGANEVGIMYNPFKGANEELGPGVEGN